MRLLFAAAALLGPALPLACPSCATDRGPHAALLVGAVIAAPYVVAAVVIRAIRAGGREP
jgi:hypothetical protein